MKIEFEIDEEILKESIFTMRNRVFRKAIEDTVELEVNQFLKNDNNFREILKEAAVDFLSRYKFKDIENLNRRLDEMKNEN